MLVSALFLLAVAVQVCTAMTGLHVLAQPCVSKSRHVVAVSSVLASVSAIAALIMALQPSEPRLAFGLAPLLMILHGGVITWFHLTVPRLKRQAGQPVAPCPSLLHDPLRRCPHNCQYKKDHRSS